MRLTSMLHGALLLAVAVPAAAQDKSPSAAKGTPSSKDASPSSAAETGKSTASDSPSQTSQPSATDGSSTQQSTTTDKPSITGGSTATSGGGLSGFPTLTGPGVIPSYPPPSVPPVANAPFMQQSSMPEGTVFIVVGAVLGTLGLAVLVWRLITGMLLHRNVKRAARAQHHAENNTKFPPPPAPFYKYSDLNSSMSLGPGGSSGVAGRGVRRTNRGPVPSSTPSSSNLFFSPTAGNQSAPNRGSTFLPSGFYAAGQNSPGPYNQTNNIGLVNMRPDSRGHSANASRQTLDLSPEGSPQFTARRDISTSSLNVNLAPGQRAPSAYLDDLLTDDPSALPPPHMPGTGTHSRSGSPGRY